MSFDYEAIDKVIEFCIEEFNQDIKLAIRLNVAEVVEDINGDIQKLNEAKEIIFRYKDLES